MLYDRRLAGQPFAEEGTKTLAQRVLESLKIQTDQKTRHLPVKVGQKVIDQIRLPPLEQFHDFASSRFTGFINDEGDASVELIVTLPSETHVKLETGRYTKNCVFYRFELWVTLKK